MAATRAAASSGPSASIRRARPCSRSSRVLSTRARPAAVAEISAARPSSGSGTLQQIPPANAATLTGKEFFPHLISQPFHHGLVVVFTAAALMMLVGALASLFRGGKYVHDDGALSDATDGERMGEDDPVEPLESVRP